MVKNWFRIRRPPHRLLVQAAAALLSTAAAGQGASGPDTTIAVADWRTGLALYGFDPVSYFADREPRAGSPELVSTRGSVTWCFRNEGNRAAFEAHPDVYVPRFGGYDPIALARGVTTAGSPLVWLIHGERLYLFHDAAAQRQFAAEPAAAVAAAVARWTVLRKQAGY